MVKSLAVWVVRFAGSNVAKKYGPAFVTVLGGRIDDWLTKRFGKETVDKRSEERERMLRYKEQVEVEIAELRRKGDLEAVQRTAQHLAEVVSIIRSWGGDK